MRRKSHFLLILSLIFLFALQNDRRDERFRSNFTRFLKSEQEAFRLAKTEMGEANRFTGVQYAALQNYYMTLDPELLRVPQERLIRAKALAISEKEGLKKKSAMDFPPLWNELDADMGGRVRALMWDPNDADYRKVWAAGVTGGLWCREDIFDDNSRWKPVEGLADFLNINCITHDPLNPEIFYAGTGEGQTARIIYRGSGGRGRGILKSSDGGETWSLLESSHDFAYVNDVVVRDEAGISVIYAAVSSGRYQGILISSEPGDGLYRSVDGGNSWQQVIPENLGDRTSWSISDIELSASGRIFLGTGISPDGKGGGRILYSDNGFDWTLFDDYVSIIENEPIYNYPGRVILAAAPSDSNRIYAFLTAAGNDFYSFKSPRCRYVLKSEDGGQSWTQTGEPSAGGSWAYIAWHALVGAVSPLNPDVLFAGGLDLHRSGNGGEIWAQFSSWFNFTNDPSRPNYVHADQHSIRFRPENPAGAVFATDGGVFLTNNTDVATPAMVEKNHGFNTLQYYTCAIDPRPGKYHFLAGAQDNGTVRYHDRTKAVNIGDNVSYGDGAFCFIDEDTPDLQITSSQFNYLYVNPAAFNNYDSTKAVNTFQTGLFINAMDYDSRTNVLFANDGDFYGRKADTLLRIWDLDKVAKASRIGLGLGLEVPITAITVSPYSSEGSTLIAGTQNGRLLRVRNADSGIKGNSSVYEVEEISSDGFPAANIVCIAYGGSANHFAVIFSNYGVSSVWETMDGGISWKEKEANLPDMPVRWAVYHPENPERIMLATEAGLWFTDNFQDEEFSWSPVPDFPSVRVDMIRVRKSDKHMIAATHGRGLWYGSWYPLFRDNSELVDLKLFPNPANNYIVVELPGASKSGKTILTIYDLSGKQIYISEDKFRSGTLREKIDISFLKSGQYILRVETKNAMHSGSFVVRK